MNADDGEAAHGFGLADSESELHDRTIQALYGVGLRLEHGLELVGEAPEEAKTVIDGAIVTLAKLIEDIRSRIYELGRL